MTRWRSLAIRYRTTVLDGFILLAIMSAAVLLAWEVQIFPRPGVPADQDLEIDLDEALLLFGLLATGLLVFAIRRYIEQRREHSRRLVAESQVRVLAFEDALTGLPNRRRFDQALAAAIAAPASADGCHALILVDLNGFKQVNDVHGHPVGDAVLSVVAQRLNGAVKAGDLVSRFGGDEFAILALHLSGSAAASAIAHRIIESLALPVRTGRLSHAIGAGIGIALLPTDADTAVEALRRADVALYRAKTARASTVRFFEPQMDQLVFERAELVQELRDALVRDEIRPRFQPVIDLRSRRVVAFEAAPAWMHPRLGRLGPEQFIPFAEEEEDGLIHQLAHRVLALSCAAAALWPDGIGLSLDVFSSQLRDHGLPQQVAAILDSAGLAPERLEFEIAESALVRDIQDVKDVIGRLRAMGVRVAIDHFGAGYSSLYHLRAIKVDRVKIDRGFVQDLDGQASSRQVVDALIGLGKGLGYSVTADGVLTAAQEASLLQSGCEQGQGAVFSLPMSEDETSTYLGLGSERLLLGVQGRSPS